MSLKSWHAHVAQTTGSNFRVNDAPRFAAFTHPGLNHSGLDRLGGPDVTSLMQLLNDAFDFSIGRTDYGNSRTPSLLDYARLMQNRMLFHAVMEYTISRAMYDREIPKWPLDAKVSYGGLGNSSTRTLAELFVPGSNEPIISRIGKSILIDQTARRSTPFPDWLREELEGKAIPVENIQMPRFSRPPQAFVHRTKVVKSDTDGYNHTTYTSYVLYGIDTLYLALLEKSGVSHVGTTNSTKFGDVNTETNDAVPVQRDGTVGNCTSAEGGAISDARAIQWMTEETMRNGLKKLTISYIKECAEGDEIDVFVWQENGEKLIVRCSIESKAGTNVHSQLILEYFAPEPRL